MKGSEVPHGELAGAVCLVTGAGGFLGSALCRALAAAGAEIHGAVRPSSSPGTSRRLAGLPEGVTLHPVDLAAGPTTHELLRRLRPAYIFHAACHSSRGYAGPEKGGAPLAALLADDVLSLAHLLDAAAGSGLRRLVHLASSLEVGPVDRPQRGDEPVRPAVLRGVTKGAATLLAQERARPAAAGGAGLPVVVVRPFHVYGPGEARDRLIPRAVRAALAGEALPLTGGPPQRRDPVYVDDVAEACLRAATAEGCIGSVIPVGTGRGVTHEELTRAVSRAVGKPLAVDVGAFPAGSYDMPLRVADPSVAREKLGWTASTSLEAGLEATAAWIREQDRARK